LTNALYHTNVLSIKLVPSESLEIGSNDVRQQCLFTQNKSSFYRPLLITVRSLS